MIPKTDKSNDIQIYFKKLSKKHPTLKYNKYFVFWFAGYLNRRGSFNLIYGANIYPRISIADEDTALLTLIQKKIGFGYFTPKKDELIFYSKEEVSIIIDLINPLLFSDKKQKDFSQLLQAFNSRFKTNIPSETPKEEWFKETTFFKPFFTGFFEGGRYPFAFNYYQKNYSFFPVIAISSKFNPKLLKRFKKYFSFARSTNSSIQLDYPLNYPLKRKPVPDLIFFGFHTQNLSFPPIEPLLNFLNTTTFYGKKKEALKEYNIILDNIKKIETKFSEERKDLWKENLNAILNFFKNFNEPKLKSASVNSKFFINEYSLNPRPETTPEQLQRQRKPKLRKRILKNSKLFSPARGPRQA